MAITAVGAFLIPAPGPGWLIVALGLGLMASDIRPLATYLDRSELRVRAVSSWLSSWWATRSQMQRVALGGVVAASAIGFAYGVLRLFVLR